MTPPPRLIGRDTELDRRATTVDAAADEAVAKARRTRLLIET